MRTNRLRGLLVLTATVYLGTSAVITQQQQPRTTGGTATAPATPTQTADAAMTPAEVERRGQQLAKVGDVSITLGEFEDAINEAPAPVRQAYTDPARRREFLENMIRTTLLANEARRRGADRNPEVASAIRRILAQKLQQVAVLAAVTPESIPQADVDQYYNAHTTDYQRPEFRRATVAYVDDQAAAQALATDLQGARGDMRRIQALVRERSTDAPSRERQGDLFYFKRDGAGNNGSAVIEGPLAAAVFGLAREMDVTAPIHAANGKWALLVLTGIQPAINRTLGEPAVVNSIRGFIMRERRTQKEAQLLQELRDRMHPEIHEDRLDLIQLPAQDLGGVPGFDPAHGVGPTAPPSGAATGAARSNTPPAQGPSGTAPPAVPGH